MKLEKVLDKLGSLEKNSFIKIIDNIISKSPKNSKEIDKILSSTDKGLKSVDNQNIAKIFALRVKGMEWGMLTRIVWLTSAWILSYGRSSNLSLMSFSMIQKFSPLIFRRLSRSYRPIKVFLRFVLNSSEKAYMVDSFQKIRYAILFRIHDTYLMSLNGINEY